MARLPKEQQALILACIAAGYGLTAVNTRLKNLRYSPINSATYSKYKKKYLPKIEEARDERYAEIMDIGLAKTDERLYRLQELYEGLEPHALEPGIKGTYPAAALLLKIMDDAARETGGRSPKKEHTGTVTMVIEYVDKAPDALPEGLGVHQLSAPPFDDDAEDGEFE